MRPQVRRFRNVAAQVCQKHNVRLSSFMSDHGLEEVLELAEANNWDPSTIAIEVLLECCVENGRFNNFYAGVLSVMTYLNEMAGETQEQALIDVGNILKSGPTRQAFQRWAESHYPQS